MLEHDRPARPRSSSIIDRCLSCLSCMKTAWEYTATCRSRSAHSEKDVQATWFDRFAGAPSGLSADQSCFAPSMWLARLGAPFAAFCGAGKPRRARYLEVPRFGLAESHRCSKGGDANTVAVPVERVRQTGYGAADNEATYGLEPPWLATCRSPLGQACGALTHHLGTGTRTTMPGPTSSFGRKARQMGGSDAMSSTNRAVRQRRSRYGVMFPNTDPELAQPAGIVPPLTEETSRRS